MKAIDLNEIERTIRTGNVISAEDVLELVKTIRELKAENIVLVDAVGGAREVLRKAIEGRK